MTAAKYLEKASTYKDGRWAAINMQNLADEVPVSEIPMMLPKLRLLAIGHQQPRVDKLVELNAPECILEVEQKKLDKAKNGKSPIEAILNRSFNKRK